MTTPDADHLERPAHPSTNMREHVRTRHGLDATDPLLDRDDIATWHTAQHPATDSQLPVTAESLNNLVGDPTATPVVLPTAPPRIPTDPAFRPRPKATPDDDTTTSPPRLGATVLYRSRTGTYTMPAVISATVRTLYQPNVDAGHVPALSSDLHVHLGVITCGRPGHVSYRTEQTNPELTDPDRPNVPAGGTYAEWDIPFWDPAYDGGDRLDAWLDGDLTAQPAGTWTWPVDA